MTTMMKTLSWSNESLAEALLHNGSFRQGALQEGRGDSREAVALRAQLREFVAHGRQGPLGDTSTEGPYRDLLLLEPNASLVELIGQLTLSQEVLLLKANFGPEQSFWSVAGRYQATLSEAAAPKPSQQSSHPLSPQEGSAEEDAEGFLLDLEQVWGVRPVEDAPEGGASRSESGTSILSSVGPSASSRTGNDWTTLSVLKQGLPYWLVMLKLDTAMVKQPSFQHVLKTFEKTLQAWANLEATFDDVEALLPLEKSLPSGQLKQLRQQLTQAIALLSQQKQNLLESLSYVLDDRLEALQGHSARVAQLTRQLGEAFGLNEKTLDLMEMAAQFHGLGRLNLPELGGEARPLKNEEWQAYRQHPILGAKLFLSLSTFQEAAPYLAYHLERWNGSGPYGLNGDNSPFGSRVIGVAKAYTALREARAYRSQGSRTGLSHAEALKALQADCGRLWDARIVERLASLGSETPTGQN
jgi:HD-GYP domain-containing protein (c-di-GMP phosphodiesterase class II)